jgi:exodeoxyribonuclease V alpha subunit
MLNPETRVRLARIGWSDAVVLPPDAEHRLLSRELLYTAVSRARRNAELWATPNALQTALARRVARHGGLRDRLAAARHNSL